jgi:biotin carboxyl carrier protein
MDAAVAHTPVAVGDRVAKGAAILVLEAMKMEVVLSAPHAGVLEALHVGVGDAVKSGAVLAFVRADSSSPE